MLLKGCVVLRTTESKCSSVEVSIQALLKLDGGYFELDRILILVLIANS